MLRSTSSPAIVTQKRVRSAPLCFLALVLVLASGSCSSNDSGGSGNGGEGEDVGRDGATRRDMSVDPSYEMGADDTQVEPTEEVGDEPREEVGDEPREEVGDDPGEEVRDEPTADASDPCPYPSGPYGFNAANDVVGPMEWPSAASGTETLAADLAEIRCDPSVNSIFIQIAAKSCTYCPARMREIGGLESHWETYGAKWIFVVIDASSASDADTYVNRYGVDFGWRTNDADNSLGANTIADSDAFAAQPWTGVIRPSDMVLVYDEPDDAYLDIEQIAEDMAGE